MGRLGVTERSVVCVVDPSVGPRAVLVPALVRAGATVIGAFSPAAPNPAGHAGNRHLAARVRLRADTLDTSARRLRGLGVRAVLVGAETGVEWAAALSAQADLPTHAPELALARADKFHMNDAVRRAGLRTLPFRRAASPRDVLPWWRDALGGRPVVVKPLRGHSGTGVRICRTADAIRVAFTTLLSRRGIDGRPNTHVLVQELGEGHITEVGTVSCRGTHEVCVLLESRKTGPAFDMLRAVQAAEVPGMRQRIAYAFQVLDALGIRDGAAFVEVMVLADGSPVMIECNARMIGGLHDGWARQVFTRTQADRSIRAALDPAGFLADHTPVTAARTPGRIVALRSDAEGHVVRAPNLLEARLRHLPSTAHLYSKLRRGRRVVPTRDAATCLGLAYLAHPDPDVVRSDHQTIRALEAAGAYRALVA